MDTIYLLLGIIGFFLIIAIFFFGGFVLLDFLWGRRGRRLEYRRPRPATRLLRDPLLEDLLLVDLGCLILHEAHDEDRLARLRERMEAEREQRNPVIISRTRIATSSSTGPTGYAPSENLVPASPSSRWSSRRRRPRLGPPPERDRKDRTGQHRRIEVSDGPGVAPLAEVETAGGETLLLSAKEDGLRGRVRALWDLQSFYPKGVVVRRVEPDGAVRLSGGEALIVTRRLPRESWPRSLTQVPYCRPG